ncbi:nucleoside monophosphate kinase [Candidatus Saccharibacteria bacterium]|nr:nucleoside monophosphate kinase [Candidatus Saccharibacteria bacterium]MCA9328299.1 nucleoside monophosphate kinase [Candidatus Saccharibacteria bacterium]
MILFIGVVGAGKSVQGRYLSDLLGFPWISTGEILRQHIAGELREKMLRGDLLSDDDLYEVITPILEELIGTTEIILDGFPRTIAQAEWLERFIERNKSKVSCIIHLEADEDEVTERLLKRGRPDDTKEVIVNRFNEYRTKTLPIISYFEENGAPVIHVDGNGTEQEVRERVTKAVTDLGIHKA